ncbi:pyridoxal-5'-phosphate-dependent protein [Candidatus Poribacteria bacterium]|nr:pyridoxal-5'-phosphate-dependent protein [Candidatus Poribacteria bacterium]
MRSIQMAGPWITEHEKKTVVEMMECGWDNYDYVEKFEPAFAAWHDRKYCLMTSCCTHAIHLLLLSLGIEEGDEVIVPECTWTATAAPVTYQKATPVFADINHEDWCLDPQSVERKITGKTKAIIVVDLYGNMPAMDSLQVISKKYDIPLIEDAAEALGSKYKGIRAGKFGLGAVHSFHRTKTITTGEGGALLLDEGELYQRAKFLRDHGRSAEIPYHILEAAPKYMPSNLQASLGLAQFQRVCELVERKRYLLHRYKENLLDIEDLAFNVETDEVYNGAWATTIVFGKSHKMTKQKAIEKLAVLNVPARPFFYPLSSLPAYKHYKTGSREENPNAYDISSRGITLSCHYKLTDKQIDFMCEAVRKILGQ